VINQFSQLAQRVDAAQLRRGEVAEVTESGMVIVSVGDEHGNRQLRCDVLATTDTTPAVLAPGDSVLAWLPADGSPAVVVGRIGPSRVLTPAPDDTPETLTLEAKRSLTLRVGDGSITIREDGKILIKGKDLVSHAQRTNRIKGGAVAIN
jgi:hypothetical protein